MVIPYKRVAFKNVTTIFLNMLHNLGYNLKNARKGKSISNIPKWPSLRSLALNSKLIRQFEFLEILDYISIWKMMLESKVFLSSNFSHASLLSFFKIQTVMKSHSLVPGASNLAILMFSKCFFHFWHS